MQQFLQETVIGLLLYGAVYAVAASGLVVTYATSGVFNFAHGAIGMIGAFTYWEIENKTVLPPIVAVAIVLLVEAPAIGLLVEWGLIRRLASAGAERALMVTLGLMVILLGLASEVFGTTSQIVALPFFNGHNVRIGGVNVSDHDLMTAGIAIVVAVGLQLLLKKTRTGVAMRAVVDDPQLLSMAGASPARIARYGWVLGAMLAAAAGILIAPDVNLDQTQLTLFVLSGFAAAVFGRLRSLPMTFVGAAIVGLTQQYFQGYVSHQFQNDWVPNAKLALPMVALFVFLLLLPSERLRAVGRASVTRIPKVPSRNRSLVGAGGAIALAVIGALVLSGTNLVTLGDGFVFAILGLSLVLLTGYAGQVSLGQVAFFGIGAVVYGKTFGGGSWWGLVLAVAISAAAGAVVALPTLRLRGLYLALATLAFAQFCYYIIFTNANHIVTSKGNEGILPIGRLELPGINLGGVASTNKGEVVFLGVAFALALLLVLGLRRGTFGRRLVAFSDSPAACATVGLDVKLTRLAVFSISAGLAGFAGVLWGGLQNQVQTTAPDLTLLPSLLVLLMLVIWGVRNASGALLAGMSYALLLSHQNIGGIIIGLGVIFIGLLPNGLVGTGAPWLESMWNLRHSPLPPPSPPSAVLEGARVA